MRFHLAFFLPCFSYLGLVFQWLSGCLFLTDFSFLRCLPSRKAPNHRILPVGNCFSDLFLDAFAFLGFPRAWDFPVPFYLIPSHRQKIQNSEASWSLGTGSSSFRSTHILYCANSASDSHMYFFVCFVHSLAGLRQSGFLFLVSFRRDIRL